MQQLVQPKGAPQPGAARQKQLVLLRANGNHRDERNCGVDGRAGVADAAAEVDGVAGPGGPVRVVVATREVDDHGCGPQRFGGALARVART